MSETDLNLYGDRLMATTGSHGADIASQRLDELDKEALLRILSLQASPIVCLDLGCGLGWQGSRFAMLGAAAYLFDLLPESALVATLREKANLYLSYWQGDLRLLQGKDIPLQVHLAYSQRFIHYLRYSEAERLIRFIGERMESNSYFYISASGLNSELGVDYVGANTEVRNRFFCLSTAMQAKHGIREPICLYTEIDLTQLMTANNFTKCRVWKSDFGNIKGVFQKSS